MGIKYKHGRVGVKRHTPQQFESARQRERGFQAGLNSERRATAAFLRQLLEISRAADIKKAITAHLEP
jgi:hypothetical protein